MLETDSDTKVTPTLKKQETGNRMHDARSTMQDTGCRMIGSEIASKQVLSQSKYSQTRVKNRDVLR
ncbi:MAG: hypothetical protein WBD99_15710 [Thermodesulfobacteriota bacterium]